MLVYRFCKKNEIDMLFNNMMFRNMNKLFETENQININSCISNKNNIPYTNTKQDMFICTYNIPKCLLKNYPDINYYYNKIYFSYSEKVSEDIIKNKFINFNSLLRIEKILGNIEDYMHNSISFKTVYLNNEIIDKLSNCNNCNKVLSLYSILMDSNIKESITSNIDNLIYLIPEIKSMIGFEHKHPHHHLDVWEHTLYALSLSKKNFDLRLSLLLHDIGKPFSFSENDGIRHFYNHPYVSSKMAKSILTRLGFNEQYINKICYLISFHDTPISKKDVSNNYNLALTRYLMQECDALAHNPDKLEKRKEYLESVKKLIFKNQ